MTAQGPQGAKSKSAAPQASYAQARHDALIAAKALMQFPPSTSDPKVYQEWRSRMEGLLNFADGGPGCEPTRAPTINGPGAGGDKTREPRGQPRGECQDETVLPRTSPPAADRLNCDCGKTISVGLSTTRNRDLRNDLNNRLYEDIHTHIKRRREHHHWEDRDNDIAEDCLALSPEFRQTAWPKKFKIDVLRYDGTTNPRDFLQLYSLAAVVVGADEIMMASWFPLALKGDAQSWLLNLPSARSGPGGR